MKQPSAIAKAVCRKVDTKLFESAGFTALPAEGGDAVVHLAHPDSEAALKAVLELFSKFVPFTAHFGRTGPMARTLIASDGMSVVIIQVAASKDWEPATDTPRDYHSSDGHCLIIRHLRKSADDRTSSDARRQYRRVRSSFARLASESEVRA
jgi:hypothetical protein